MEQYTLSGSRSNPNVQYLKKITEDDAKYLRKRFLRERPYTLKQQLEHFLEKHNKDKRNAKATI